MRLSVLAGLSLSLGLSACASLAGPHAAPSCDGSARRPLNCSLWDWEAARPEVSAVPSVSKAPETGAVAAASRPAQPTKAPHPQPVSLSTFDSPNRFVPAPWR